MTDVEVGAHVVELRQRGIHGALIAGVGNVEVVAEARVAYEIHGSA